MTENPKDIIRFSCTKCHNEMDDEKYNIPECCSCVATRDHAPTLCPCRGEPDWKEKDLLYKHGAYP